MARTDEQVYVMVEGRQIELAAGKLLELTVDQTLTLPDVCTILLHDGLQWLRDDTFGIGKEVELSMAQGSGSRRKLFVGEITAIEPSLSDDNQANLLVRGFDKSHRLQRGRKTRGFEQVTDSDIAQRIANELGLSNDIQATSQVHAHVLQNNQTDLEFLMARAAPIGYQVGVAEDTLYFKPVGEETLGGGPGGAAGVSLRWGESLLRFDVSRTTPGQATEVVIRGWDVSKKAAIVGRAERSDAGPTTDLELRGGEVVRSAFGYEAPMTVVRELVASQAEAEQLAQAICDELNGSFTTADGVAIGNPAITPGATLEVQGVGVFSGRYVVSQAVHRFDSNGYETSFSVGGAQTSRPVGGEASGRPPLPPVSMAVGIVTDNKDPEGFGRVKVQFPTLGEKVQSDWCRLVTPMAGADRGFFTLPEINDEVLVAAAEWSRPVVIGSLWNGVDKPPVETSEAVHGGKVDLRSWVSRSGHRITFDDTQNAEKVTIADKNGNLIEFDCSSNKLTLKTAGDLAIEAGGNLNLTANGQVNVQGSRINLN